MTYHKLKVKLLFKQLWLESADSVSFLVLVFVLLSLFFHFFNFLDGSFIFLDDWLIKNLFKTVNYLLHFFKTHSRNRNHLKEWPYRPYQLKSVRPYIVHFEITATKPHNLHLIALAAAAFLWVLYSVFFYNYIVFFNIWAICKFLHIILIIEINPCEKYIFYIDHESVF